MLIHRQATERMISSSAWQTYHQPWEHPHCGITTCVVNGLAWWAKVLQFTWDVSRRKDIHASIDSLQETLSDVKEVCWGVTVHLRCPDDLPPRRYVIVQLPRANFLNFCELQVFVRRTYLSRLLPLLYLHSLHWLNIYFSQFHVIVAIFFGISHMYRN